MDWFILIIFLLTAFTVFWFAIKKPYWTIGMHHLETYAISALIGPLIFVITGNLNFDDVISLTTGSTNPINILVLFLSMVFLSVYLDEVGVMEYFARLALNFSGTSAKRLFFILYFVVSLLTIFTSNDIIILTLTPFIYYFTKHAKLDPKPYLIAEFFAANTWSILLIIGNPTNIYATSSYGITFFAYLKIMFIPTIIAGLLNLIVLYLIFRKDISGKFSPDKSNPNIALRDKTGAIIGTIILIVCTISLAFSETIGLAMWKIALYSAILLIIIIFVRHLFNRRLVDIGKVFSRVPWSVILFVFSFFLMTQALFRHDMLSEISGVMSGIFTNVPITIMLMGLLSAIFANLLNNILNR